MIPKSNRRPTERVTLTIPVDVLREIEALATEEGLASSQAFIRKALERLTDNRKKAMRPFEVGQIVRLVACRGWVKKVDAGRLVTIRQLAGAPPSSLSLRDMDVCVDDGDPANPELRTNGHRMSLWIPFRAIELFDLAT